MINEWLCSMLVRKRIAIKQMARKISKNSRAARQSDAYEMEAKVLADLPRPEKTDLTSILIRTTAKNEALLEAKLHKKDKNKIGKKSVGKKSAFSITSLDRDRVERALNVTNRLDGKIAKSVSRAKYVQSARKAGWDSTNELIKKETESLNKKNDSLAKIDTKDTKEDSLETSEKQMDIEPSEQEDIDPVQEPEVSKAGNIFSVLTDDVEV